MKTTQFNGLIKWTILQNDKKIKRHVIYTEESLDIFESKEKKADFQQIQYDKFFHMVGKVYSEITKKWIKIGDVEIFYKGMYTKILYWEINLHMSTHFSRYFW